MNNTRKKLYTEWWFWGALIFLVASVYFILNIDNFTTGTFDAEAGINPYTREIGSGTRSAFTEVTGLVDKNDDDNISPTVTVQNSTNAITQTVSSDPHSISYISLGSLNDSVKALSVDGTEPTRDAIREGDYQLVREFSMVYGKELSETAQDFWNFMFSAQAQAIVEEAGFVAVDVNAPEYESSDLSGSIMIVGSTSVEPVVQLFSEEYRKYNPNVTIDITSPGSGAGITTAIEGSSDLGMTSRATTEEENAQLIESQAIAIDGIVMIANNQNPIEDITYSDIRHIFMSDYDTNITWNHIIK